MVFLSSLPIGSLGMKDIGIVIVIRVELGQMDACAVFGALRSALPGYKVFQSSCMGEIRPAVEDFTVFLTYLDR